MLATKVHISGLRLLRALEFLRPLCDLELEKDLLSAEVSVLSCIFICYMQRNSLGG